MAKLTKKLEKVLVALDKIDQRVAELEREDPRTTFAKSVPQLVDEVEELVRLGEEGDRLTEEAVALIRQS